MNRLFDLAFDVTAPFWALMILAPTWSWTAQVITETVSAELTITRPSEIALHEKTFTLLADQAAYNDAARALIGRALERRTGAA
ncbi:abscisic acid-deficient protein Aba4 family protein [Nocardia australiensis]|uniref:abscisic acid-deficient protein Aba4 family protein n=1 Tax=Nocardia australiensis TaxID=2887191 RepID=UPI001D13D565|nr:abscisic acid-deficient protein Aba4 family protein [Nocardia australiensis]